MRKPTSADGAGVSKVKVAILAGGYGTRLSEETDARPKPMVEIGTKPIIWHIMKHYSHYGFNEFVILAGYKSYMIKEYFANYYLHNSDISVDTKGGKLTVHSNDSEAWTITVAETGLDTMTGGRVKRAQKYLGEAPFLLTYGDGLTDLDIKKLVKFHESKQQVLTLTAIQPEGRFGALDIRDDATVARFLEKPKGDGSWVNGGFFVCEPKIFDYITEGDKTILERSPMEGLARDGQINAYKHDGFWKCMDTMRDKQELNSLWSTGEAPWKTK
jgi:glucose-1-phosphate cytidylyltransferase